MLRLFKWLWTGDSHLHKWEIIERNNVFQSGSDKTLPVAIDFVMQCEVCGDIKVKRT